MNPFAGSRSRSVEHMKVTRLSTGLNPGCGKRRTENGELGKTLEFHSFGFGSIH
jgi:hypothetical protein